MQLEARLRNELGMPFLPTVFTLLADHGCYLVAAVDAFLAQRPNRLEANALASRRIGSEAAAALVHTPLRAGSAAQPIGELIDTYNQVNPPSLLFTTFLLGERSMVWRVMEPPLPALPPGDARGSLLVDVNACHGDYRVPGFWRELAEGWPEHAPALWALARRLPLSDRFARARDEVRALASEAVAGRDAPTPEDVSCTSAQAGEISRILSFYELVIPTMLIEIECLRRALDLDARGSRSSGSSGSAPRRRS